MFGYVPVMYSRRHLVSNFNLNYNENVKNPNTITEEVLKESFKIFENEYGTQLFSSALFNGRALKKYDALYYFINTVFVSDEDVLNFITNKELTVPSNDGFLNKKTIYKLKGGEN